VSEAWTAEALASRVEELAVRRESFVSAVQRFAEELNESDRELLGRVLLERANTEAALGRALGDRLEPRGWLGRTLRRAEERAARLRSARGNPPPEH